ncbi:MAG TPA: hypothetical protein VIL20_03015 [Sandaracinaceae bacterium]
MRGVVDLGGGPRGAPDALGGFVAARDAEGGHVWSRVLLPIVSAAPMDVRVGPVARDDAGGLAVAGRLLGYADFGLGARRGSWSIFLVRYGPHGEPRWDRILTPDGGSLFTEPRALGIHPSGEVLVAGVVDNSIDLGDGRTDPIGGHGDAFVSAYGGDDGCPRWALRLGGQSSDAAQGLTFTSDGGLVLAGFFSRNALFGAEVRTAEGERALFVTAFDSTPACCDPIGARCSGAGTCYHDLGCAEGKCRPPFRGCGAFGEECCDGDVCDELFSCVDGRCMPCGSARAECCPPPNPCPYFGTCVENTCR